MTDSAVPASGDDPGAECSERVCVTCSDRAETVRLVELLGNGRALVDTGAGTEEVSVALVEAGVGDRVLVHAKEALAIVADH